MSPWVGRAMEVATRVTRVIAWNFMFVICLSRRIRSLEQEIAWILEYWLTHLGFVEMLCFWFGNWWEWTVGKESQYHYIEGFLIHTLFFNTRNSPSFPNSLPATPPKTQCSHPFRKMERRGWHLHKGLKNWTARTINVTLKVDRPFIPQPTHWFIHLSCHPYHLEEIHSMQPQ